MNPLFSVETVAVLAAPITTDPGHQRVAAALQGRLLSRVECD